MKVLLDECVPWPMHKLLVGHDCSNAQRQGWNAVKNGDLLQLAELHFDLFITSDQGIRYHQNLADRRIAIIEISTNDLGRIQANAMAIKNAVESIRAGEFLSLRIG